MPHRLFIALSSLLLFCTAYAAAPILLIDAVKVDPNEVATKIPTDVLFKAKIYSDANHIPKAVHLLRLQWSGDETPISKMWDNGTHGDAVAKDGVYTCDLTLKEPIIGLLSFRIQVRYKGSRTPVRSPAIFVKVAGGN